MKLSSISIIINIGNKNMQMIQSIVNNSSYSINYNKMKQNYNYYEKSIEKKE
jgi:hypothetical protein